MIELVEGRKGDQIAKAIREDLGQRFELRMDVEVVPTGTVKGGRKM